MLQKLTAEIIFLEPDDVRPAVIELGELGFKCEVLHWTEPHSEATWILARIDTELDAGDFGRWAQSLVDGLGGDLVEAGLETTELDLERKHRDNKRL